MNVSQPSTGCSTNARKPVWNTSTPRKKHASPDTAPIRQTENHTRTATRPVPARGQAVAPSSPRTTDTGANRPYRTHCPPPGHTGPLPASHTGTPSPRQKPRNTPASSVHHTPSCHHLTPFPAISRHHAPIMQNRHPAKKPRHFPACPTLTQPPSGTSRHLIPVSCGKPREQPIFSLFRQRLAHPAHQTGNHPVPPSTRKTKKATPQDRPVTKKPPHTPKQPENARAASTRPTG